MRALIYEEALLARITKLEAQLSVVQKDAAKWRLLVDGEIVIPASERLPEHTIVLARATTDQYGGFLSGVSDEDETFDKLLTDAVTAGEET